MTRHPAHEPNRVTPHPDRHGRVPVFDPAAAGEPMEAGKRAAKG